MHKSPTYQYYVGSAGWTHASWLGSLYPEGLPPEWQLMFYSNEFSCVYLPYSEWSQRDDKELLVWADNVAARFRFVLEANPQGMSEEDKRKAALLGSSLGLLVDAAGATVRGAGVEGEVLWLEKDHDLKLLAQSLQTRRSEHAPLFIISREHDLGVMQRVKTLLEIMAL